MNINMITPAYESFVNNVIMEAYKTKVDNSSRMDLCKKIVSDKNELSKLDKIMRKKLAIKYKNPLLPIYGHNQPIKFTGKSPSENDFCPFHDVEYGNIETLNILAIIFYHSMTDQYLNYLTKWINTHIRDGNEVIAYDVKEWTRSRIEYDPFDKKVLSIDFCD